MIKKDEWYGVQEIYEQNIIYFLDSTYKIKKFIDKGLLKGNSIGKGTGKRYFVRGSEIIKFLAKWEANDFK